MHRKRRIVIAIFTVLLLFTVFYLHVGRKETENELTICIDSRNASEIEMLIRFWEIEDPEHATSIKLVKIPEERTQAQTVIRRIQTQLMAGEGPDLFLLQTVNLEEGGVLFENPEKIMMNHMFYSMNDLLSEAQHIDLQKINPLLLQAGQYQEQQYILPLYYDFFSYVIPNEISAEKASGIMKSKLDIRFLDICGDWLDYARGDVIVSKQECLQICDDIYNMWKDSEGYRQEGEKIMGGNFSGAVWTAMSDPRPHRMEAQRNYYGGISAYISFYAAINRNSHQAEAAFRMLDWMFSTSAAQKNTLSIAYGCPVNDSEWETLYAALSEEDRNAIKKILHEIDQVVFHSNADSVLKELFEEYRMARDAQEDGSSAVEKAWNQLRWIAAE